VAERLRAQGTAWRCLHDFTVLAPGTVRTQQDTPFKVFSPFRRAWLAQVRGEAIGCVAAPAARAPVQAPPLPAWPPPSQRSIRLVADRRGRGPCALEDFVEHRLARYHEDRDVPALDGTSRLSPYLAIGALSVRRCMRPP